MYNVFIIVLSWVLLWCLTGVLLIATIVSNDPVISFRNLVGYCFQTKHNSTFAQLKTGSTKKTRSTVSGIGVKNQYYCLRVTQYAIFFFPFFPMSYTYDI